jgi:hypothetical protein
MIEELSIGIVDGITVVLLSKRCFVVFMKNIVGISVKIFAVVISDVASVEVLI